MLIIKLRRRDIIEIPWKTEFFCNFQNSKTRYFKCLIIECENKKKSAKTNLIFFNPTSKQSSKKIEQISTNFNLMTFLKFPFNCCIMFSFLQYFIEFWAITFYKERNFKLVQNHCRKRKKQYNILEKIKTTQIWINKFNLKTWYFPTQ